MCCAPPPPQPLIPPSTNDLPVVQGDLWSPVADSSQSQTLGNSILILMVENWLIDGRTFYVTKSQRTHADSTLSTRDDSRWD
jgi:hypothetical protein